MFLAILMHTDLIMSAHSLSNLNAVPIYTYRGTYLSKLAILYFCHRFGHFCHSCSSNLVEAHRVYQRPLTHILPLLFLVLYCTKCSCYVFNNSSCSSISSLYFGHSYFLKSHPFTSSPDKLPAYYSTTVPDLQLIPSSSISSILTY